MSYSLLGYGTAPSPPPAVPVGPAYGVGDVVLFGIFALFVGGGAYLGYKKFPEHAVIGAAGGAGAGFGLMLTSAIALYFVGVGTSGGRP